MQSDHAAGIPGGRWQRVLHDYPPLRAQCESELGLLDKRRQVPCLCPRDAGRLHLSRHVRVLIRQPAAGSWRQNRKLRTDGWGRASCGPGRLFPSSCVRRPAAGWPPCRWSTAVCVAPALGVCQWLNATVLQRRAADLQEGICLYLRACLKTNWRRRQDELCLGHREASARTLISHRFLGVGRVNPSFAGRQSGIGWAIDPDVSPSFWQASCQSVAGQPRLSSSTPLPANVHKVACLAKKRANCKEGR